MSDYVWHRAWEPGEWESRVRYQLVQVVAWHEGTATVVDCTPNELGWASPPSGSVPYVVPIDQLRLGYPPDVEAVA